jgi:predicted acetyltransferase
MSTRVIAPSLEYEDAFLTMLADFETNEPQNAEWYAPARADFAAYVHGLLDEEQGQNLRRGWVACTHRWLLGPGEAIVGVARVRHHIDTLFLFRDGGHIGYDVAPSRRGCGFGHAALRAALAEANRLGLERVLIVTGATNLASRAVIERQGGELESIAFSEFWSEDLCRYWIQPARHA